MNNVNPGEHSISWDGRADNGSRIVPGGYTVTALVIDQDENHVKSQILTKIRY
jgi:flagellar hook assembly protein FlgD